MESIQTLRCAYESMIEADTAAAIKARIAASKAGIGVQKAQKQADIARLDQRAASIGETVEQPLDETSSSGLSEMLKIMKAIHQTEAQNTILLRRLIDILS